MMDAASAFLRVCSSFLRTLSAGGVALLCLRFAWLATLDLVQEAHQDEPVELALPGSREITGNNGKPLESMQGGVHRPDLAALQKMMGGEVSVPSSQSRTEQKRKRHLLVDIGPERSEVYVNGRRVGRTPYGGQVVCEEGDLIRVEVLPQEGAPLRRSAECYGETVAFQRGEE